MLNETCPQEKQLRGKSNWQSESTIHNPPPKKDREELGTAWFATRKIKCGQRGSFSWVTHFSPPQHSFASNSRLQKIYDCPSQVKATQGLRLFVVIYTEKSEFFPIMKICCLQWNSYSKVREEKGNQLQKLHEKEQLKI